MDIMQYSWDYWPRQFCYPPVFFYISPSIPMDFNLGQPTIGEDLPTTPQQALTNMEGFLLRTTNLSVQAPCLDYMNLNRRSRNIKVPNFVQFKCLHKGNVQRYISTYEGKNAKKSWSQEDEIILLWLVHNFHLRLGQLPQRFEDSTWSSIAKLIPFRRGQQCLFRWLSMLSSHLADNPWTETQKTELLKLLGPQNQHRDWKKISIELFKSSRDIFRSPKQCREHYELFLNPVVDRSRKMWTFEEDLRMLEAFQDLGKKWKSISKVLPDRSENAVKNRFNLLKSRFEKKPSNKRNKSVNIRFLIDSLRNEQKLQEQYMQRQIQSAERDSQTANISSSRNTAS